MDLRGLWWLCLDIDQNCSGCQGYRASHNEPYVTQDAENFCQSPRWPSPYPIRVITSRLEEFTNRRRYGPLTSMLSNDLARFLGQVEAADNVLLINRSSSLGSDSYIRLRRD